MFVRVWNHAFSVEILAIEFQSQSSKARKVGYPITARRKLSSSTKGDRSQRIGKNRRSLLEL
ncbi:hypothetical protein [Synechocystis sp. PCC 7509]|uniref:hypothetical protein n=1 Tax=Synechocystis sp. PCC 7509 TaxID=927677 RepID=UPI0002F56C48|nr:hypothetical protein [Synechocystis sp. PCC 7509]